MIQTVERYTSRAATELTVRLGLFRRLTPVSHSFGIPRGKPVDRHYIESFVAAHRADIRGQVLEGGGYVCYARRFGEDDLVDQVDILYPKPGFPDGTLVGDLATGENIATEAYDCLLLTQVFPCIYDIRGAAETCLRALKPGGVLLATLGGIGQLPAVDKREWGSYWRFTDDSARELFGSVFGEENIAVETFGNVLAACALLQCLSSEDLAAHELDHHDPEYQVTVAVRAVKPGPSTQA